MILGQILEGSLGMPWVTWHCRVHAPWQFWTSAGAPPARDSPGIQTGNVRLDGFQGFLPVDSSSPRAGRAPHGCVCLYWGMFRKVDKYSLCLLPDEEGKSRTHKGCFVLRSG